MSTVRRPEKPNSRFITFLSRYVGDSELEKLAQQDAIYQAYKAKLKAYNPVDVSITPQFNPNIDDVVSVKISVLPDLPDAPVNPKTDHRWYNYVHEVSTALNEQLPGHLGRAFNDFPIKDEKTTALDPDTLKEYFDVVTAVAVDKTYSFNVTENIGENTLDAKSKARLKELAANIVFLVCRELLDETGNLHPEICKLNFLRIAEFEKKWKAADKQFILPQILWSYCSNIVIAAFTDPSLTDKISSDIKERMGQIERYLSYLLYSGSLPSSFFIERVNAYRTYCHDIVELETLSTDKDITVHVLKDIRSNSNQLERAQYWKEICNYIVLHPLIVSSQAAREKLQTGIVQGLSDAQADEKSVDKQAASFNAGHIHLPQHERIVSTTSVVRSALPNVFFADANAKIANKFLHDLSEYIIGHDLISDDMKYRYDYQIFNEANKPVHATDIKVTALKILLENIKNAKPTESLRNVIEDWMGTAIGPYHYTRDYLLTKKTYICKTHYDVLGIRTKWWSAKTPDAQTMIDDMLKLLPKKASGCLMEMTAADVEKLSKMKFG